MRNRLARLDTIYAYIAAHPYSTCAQLASHLSRRLDLIQGDVRLLYRAGLLNRRKVDNSRPQRFLHLGWEYYVTQPVTAPTNTATTTDHATPKT